MRSLLSDDIVVELPFYESGRVEQGWFRVYRGVDEVMAFWATAWSLEGESPGLLDAEVTITRDDGRVVFVEAYGDVIMTSGRRYRNRYVLRMTVEDDRVATYREFYNPIISARAFGRDIGGGDDAWTQGLTAQIRRRAVAGETLPTRRWATVPRSVSPLPGGLFGDGLQERVRQFRPTDQQIR